MGVDPDERLIAEIDRELMHSEVHIDDTYDTSTDDDDATQGAIIRDSIASSIVSDIGLRGLTIIKNLEKQEGSKCHKGVGMIARSIASKTKGNQAHDFGKKYGKGPTNDTMNGSGAMKS
ncbi:unnamed protein product [Ilex paraguariensis]|uniref:Uncharacterized protein n=1 Tax=Ilex paraguariensis TaxID=185542 RepID=A0ABC8SSZ1_9AQUA